MKEFNYILEKILDAEIIFKPFEHIEINNFLSNEHLEMLLNDPQIHFDELNSDNELYDKLKDSKYKIQSFPGCFDSWYEYINREEKNDGLVEGKGITFRLEEYNNNKIKDLLKLLNSSEFHNTLKQKFSINKEENIISAIQKNLTGYEISPHPDIREKALTYLLNINKNDSIENYDVHTHLLEFKPEYRKIEDFWNEYIYYNRFWIRWKYCNTIKKINKNNTLLIFKPSSKPSSLHAVKLDYDHLKFQRTQIYGNLMFKNCEWTKNIEIKDFDTFYKSLE